jgi:hypothetical protein
MKTTQVTVMPPKRTAEQITAGKDRAKALRDKADILGVSLTFYKQMIKLNCETPDDYRAIRRKRKKA